NPWRGKARMDCFVASLLAMTDRVMPDPSAAERRFERALWHDDVEGYVEGHEHHGGEHESGEQRFPQRDLADRAHKTGDQEEARDIESEELHGEAEQQRRHEHRHHTAKL